MTKNQKQLILFILLLAVGIGVGLYSGPFLTTKLGRKTMGSLIALLVLFVFAFFWEKDEKK